MHCRSCASLRNIMSVPPLSPFNPRSECVSWSRECRCLIRGHRNLPVSSLLLPSNRFPLGFFGRTLSHEAGDGMQNAGCGGSDRLGSHKLLLPLGRGGIQTPPASCGRNGTVASVRSCSHLRLEVRSGNPCRKPGPWRSELHAFLDLNHEVQRDADRARSG
jgi:hypothetical protein